MVNVAMYKHDKVSATLDRSLDSTRIG